MTGSRLHNFALRCLLHIFHLVALSSNLPPSFHRVLFPLFPDDSLFRARRVAQHFPIETAQALGKTMSALD